MMGWMDGWVEIPERNDEFFDIKFMDVLVTYTPACTIVFERFFFFVLFGFG